MDPFAIETMHLRMPVLITCSMEASEKLTSLCSLFFSGCLFTSNV